MTQQNGTDHWLTFRLAGDRFAIDIHTVRELVPLRDLVMTRPPHMPVSMAGIAQVREMTIGVLDLRTMLGMTSTADANGQVIGMLDQRKQDHIDWLNELELSAKEGREFLLAIDPHKCAFGQWYDQLLSDHKKLSEFTNDDLTLLDVIERFDVPHQRIHGIAERVVNLVHQQRSDEAHQLIQDTRGTDLKQIIELFDRCRSLFSELRLGLMAIVESEEEILGVLVDSVDEVAKFSEQEINKLPLGSQRNERLVCGLAQPKDGDDLIQLLDVSSGLANLELV